MATPLRGAIVGLGAIARNGHLPGWSEVDGVEIVAAADVTWTGEDGAPDEATGLPLHATLDALFARGGLGFLDVCTPPDSHADLAEAALARGLHVLCEKPLVVDRAALERLEGAARTSGRVLFTVHNWRHAPILARVASLVAEGRVGDVERVRWEVHRTGPSKTVEKEGNWRLDPRVAGGGILIDHGWHALYVLEAWLGGRALDTVSARLEQHRFTELEVEDTADVTLTGDGVRAEMLLTWAADERTNRALVEGTRGRLVMEDDRILVTPDRGASETIAFPAALSAGSSHADWFAATAREFLTEVEDPARRGENLAVAGRVLRLLLAAQASGREGGVATAVATS